MKTNKYVCICVLIAYCLSLSSISLANSEAARSKVGFPDGQLVDFGRVSPVLLHSTVRFVNNHSDTLIVESVTTSCGCTTAPIDRDLVAPGDTATLIVELDASKKMGKTAQKVTVETNLKEDSTFIFRFLADVQRDLVVQPRSFPALMGMPLHIPREASVVLRNTGKDTVIVQKPILKMDGFIGDFSTMHDKEILLPGESLEVNALIIATQAGLRHGNVVIKSSSKYIPEMKVGIIASTK